MVFGTFGVVEQEGKRKGSLETVRIPCFWLSLPFDANGFLGCDDPFPVDLGTGEVNEVVGQTPSEKAEVR